MQERKLKDVKQDVSGTKTNKQLNWFPHPEYLTLQLPLLTAMVSSLLSTEQSKERQSPPMKFQKIVLAHLASFQASRITKKGSLFICAKIYCRVPHLVICHENICTNPALGPNSPSSSQTCALSAYHLVESWLEVFTWYCISLKFSIIKIGIGCWEVSSWHSFATWHLAPSSSPKR